jgi:hypothetical protein
LKYLANLGVEKRSMEKESASSSDEEKVGKGFTAVEPELRPMQAEPSLTLNTPEGVDFSLTRIGDPVPIIPSVTCHPDP